MKVFVCSDIHGNLRALEAVLSRYGGCSGERFLFLGDCLGYGPHQDECLDRIVSIPESTLIMGNHEEAFFNGNGGIWVKGPAASGSDVSREESTGRFRKDLREMFVMTGATANYIAAHASPDEPEHWRYIHSRSDADEIFENLDFRLCFVGHTHVPMVYTYKKGRMKFVPGEPFRLDPEDRYIINPGSVGQPRDGDPRASFCVYEPGKRTIVNFRCGYDVESEAADFRKAGLPLYFAERLFVGA